MTKTVRDNARRFLLELVGTVSLDRNDREVTNSLSVLPELYLHLLEIEEILSILGQRRILDVIRAQDVKGSLHEST